MSTRQATVALALSLGGRSSYLELGCEDNATFSKVKALRKVGVDRARGGTHRMSTEEFFLGNSDTFDVVFIDADHHHDAVLRDFRCALDVLTPNGIIVLHDCSPVDEPHESQALCGTAWRAFARHIRTRTDLDSITGDYDHGVGLVRRGPNPCPSTLSTGMDELTFRDLSRDRRSLLRLASWPEVTRWLQEVP